MNTSSPAKTSNTDTAPDYTAIKSKQRGIWSAGDYGRIGVTLQLTGELLAEAMDLRAGNSVLDVAAGNGNASLAAARRFCRVTSTDYVETLLEQSKARADAEGVTIEYQVADAENLPFDDASFDNVMSTFGVMFAPNQQRAASELARVVRPGGKIGLANWTPTGFIGQLLKTVGQYVPPPPGVQSPTQWGSQDFVQTQFGDTCRSVDITERNFQFRYASAEHWIDFFTTYYGPTLKATEAIEGEKRDEFLDKVRGLINSLNVATDGTMVVPSSYLEVVITR